MRGSGKTNGLVGIATSAVGVFMVGLGASLVRRWWQCPRLPIFPTSAETPEAADLALAVGAMADEGAPAGTAS